MIESVILSVMSMKCGGCETNVSTKLSKIEGVVSVNASFKSNQVTIVFDNEKTTLAILKAAITGAGYSVNSD
ncbi:MAG: heavy metal-associated domain-containing protein [Methylococcales bacterium]|nr:heavy metal-associated domain-containing protein [Methylococcales bacterium]